MGLAATITAAAALWVAIWALDVKAIDSFMIAIVIVVIGVTVKMLAPFKPGDRQ
ncbi:MAG TPA: hypothetical protein VFT50_12305 [Baekduia sp.]|nr:hypothetical protein [Baekduia sp.]